MSKFAEVWRLQGVLHAFGAGGSLHKPHTKRIGGTCVPSGKGLCQFMVDTMCAIVAFTWVKVLGGAFLLGSWGGLPWREGNGRQSGWV